MTTLRITNLTKKEANKLIEDLAQVPATEITAGWDLIEDCDELTVETRWGDLAIVTAKATVSLNKIRSVSNA